MSASSAVIPRWGRGGSLAGQEELVYSLIGSKIVLILRSSGPLWSDHLKALNLCLYLPLMPGDSGEVKSNNLGVFGSKYY